MNADDAFFTVLCDPSAAAALTPAQWDLLVRQCRGARVLGRLAVLMDERKLSGQAPPWARDHLIAAQTLADRHERVLRWEIACLKRVLAPLSIPVVLLKGAAYRIADLPPARGRFLGDVDILVPKAELRRVEEVLLGHGWQTLTTHPYDQRYYRTWMHELPPLIHTARQTVLDVHHTILPETGRLHPDPERLFQAARRLDDGPFCVLGPADMVLHSAAHLFQDGDLGGGARDLIDLDDLLRHFGREPGFWDQLVDRAAEQDLGRPLFYALRFVQRFLHTPIPEATLAKASSLGPGRRVRWLMDRLVARAIAPTLPSDVGMGKSLACWLLYVRSHWLRMPPRLLAAHLLRKTFRRWYEEAEKPITQPVLPDASAEAK